MTTTAAAVCVHGTGRRTCSLQRAEKLQYSFRYRKPRSRPTNGLSGNITNTNQGRGCRPKLTTERQDLRVRPMDDHQIRRTDDTKRKCSENRTLFRLDNLAFSTTPRAAARIIALRIKATGEQTSAAHARHATSVTIGLPRSTTAAIPRRGWWQ